MKKLLLSVSVLAIMSTSAMAKESVAGEVSMRALKQELLSMMVKGENTDLFHDIGDIDPLQEKSGESSNLSDIQAINSLRMGGDISILTQKDRFSSQFYLQDERAVKPLIFTSNDQKLANFEVQPEEFALNKKREALISENPSEENDVIKTQFLNSAPLSSLVKEAATDTSISITNTESKEELLLTALGKEELRDVILDTIFSFKGTTLRDLENYYFVLSILERAYSEASQVRDEEVGNYIENLHSLITDIRSEGVSEEVISSAVNNLITQNISSEPSRTARSSTVSSSVSDESTQENLPVSLQFSWSDDENPMVAFEKYMLKVKSFNDLRSLIETQMPQSSTKKSLLKKLEIFESKTRNKTTVVQKKVVKEQAPDEDINAVKQALKTIGMLEEEIEGMKSNTYGFLSHAIKKESNIESLMEAFKKAINDQEKYYEFLDLLKKHYSSFANKSNLFNKLIESEKRKENLLDLSKVSFSVAKKEVKLVQGDNIGGLFSAPPPPSFGPPPPPGFGPPPPPGFGPPPPSFGMKVPSQVEPLEKLSSVLEKVKVDSQGKGFIVQEDTLKKIFLSWLGEKAVETGSSLNIKNILRNKEGDINKISSYESLLGSIEKLMPELVKGDTPLFKTTQTFRDEIEGLLKDLIVGKLENDRFEDGIEKTLHELVNRTIKTNSVENERLSVVADQLGRSLKVSGAKDFIKDFITLFSQGASSIHDFDTNKFMLNIKKFEEMREFITAQLPQSSLKTSLLRKLDVFESKVISKGTSQKKSKLVSLPVKTDEEVEAVKNSLKHIGKEDVIDSIKPNVYGLLADSIRKGKDIHPLMADIKKAINDQEKYYELLEYLENHYSSSSIQSDLFKKILEREEYEANLLELPKLSFVVAKKEVPLVQEENIGGISSAPPPPSFGPPPPPGFGPPPPSMGMTKKLAEPEKIEDFSTIFSEVKFDSGSKRLTLEDNTLPRLFNSWLQTRAKGVKSSVNVKTILRKNENDIKNLSTYESIVSYVVTLVPDLMSGDKPLFASTQELREDVETLLKPLVMGKIDDTRFEGGIEKSLQELIGRTIKPRTVENARNDVIATTMGRNFKVSGENELIKNFLNDLRVNVVSSSRHEIETN